MPPLHSSGNTPTHKATTTPRRSPTNSTWPYLIRIRYRLHDSRGSLQSNLNGNTVLGKWFEQIIKVNRPTP